MMGELKKFLRKPKSLLMVDSSIMRKIEKSRRSPRSPLMRLALIRMKMVRKFQGGREGDGTPGRSDVHPSARLASSVSII